MLKKWRYETILWLQMVKNVIKGSFPISKVLVFEGNSYVCWKMKMSSKMKKKLQMVKNVIKGSFPISKVLVFEGNSYVCWKNEDNRLFYDCTW